MSEARLPETGLGDTTGQLDPTDPFDSAVIGFKEGADNDSLPTQAEQRALIKVLQCTGASSDALLEETHAGFIAAASYPFKPYVEQHGLVLDGTIAFRAAAKTYDIEGDGSFYDYAIVAIRRLLTQAHPEASIDTAELYPERPMESLLHFVAGLEPIDDAEHAAELRREEAQQKLHTAGLTPNEWKILPVLHLHDDGAESRNVMQKLGLETQEELALLAMEEN